MDSILMKMINRYEKNLSKLSAIKQVIQECILSALSRTDFFNFASFYGGTVLRIFYGLDRFSEDLDFSLKSKNEDFSIEKYLDSIEKNLNALGLKFTVTEKQKSNESNIMSAFVKGNTKETIINFDVVDETINQNELIKIKIEVDIEPPENANFENKYLLLPYNSCINVYDEASLFAGKLHAVICRAWKNRVKGRDLYDYLFYLTRNSKVNFSHLKSRLVDSDFLNNSVTLDEIKLKEILIGRFETIDFDKAKQDVLPFLDDIHKIDVWNRDLFISATKEYFFV